MGLFSAEEVEYLGKRAIRLTYRYELDFDRPPRLITLSVQKELTGFTRFPAAYEYLEGTGSQLFPTKEANPRPFPTIHIVAAPGVSVLVQNWEDPDPKRRLQPSPEYPAFMVYRVQDPELVPAIGMPISSSSLTGCEPVNSDVIIPRESPIISLPSKQVIGNVPSNYPSNYFELYRQPGEVLIHHPYSATTLTISVPQFSSTPGVIRDAQARFCYEFDPQGVYGDANKPLLKIVKTKTPGPKKPDEPDVVDIWVSGSSRLNPAAALGFWEIYEVDDVNAVPPQGSPLVPNGGWSKVSAVSRPQYPPDELLAMAAFDTAIGLIPVVGNLVTIAEFSYGIATGRDKWGRQFTRDDLIFLGINAVLSLLSMYQAAKGPSQDLVRLLRQRFGRNERTVEQALAAMKRASPTKEEADLIRKLEGLVSAKRTPSAEDLQRLEAFLRRMEFEYPSLESMLNTDRTGFTHPQLQEAYQSYYQKTKKPLGPDVWAKHVSVGKPRLLLLALLGPNFAQKVRPASIGQLMNILCIPLPKTYTEALIQADLKRVLGRKDELMELLGTFFKEPLPNDPAIRRLALFQINSGNFRRLKGLLAEILSLKEQLKILEKLRIVYNEPKAFLIKGVRARLMSTEKLISQRKLSPELLFTDDIVAVQRGGMMKVLGVIEVKSGYQGGQEATSQVFRWVEELLTDGSQVVLPKGACYIDVNSTVTQLKEGLVFTYKARRGTPEVINLTTADRYIITASGKSHLGINSSEQLARPVPKGNRRELERKSEELDYLVGRILTMWLTDKL